MRHASGVRRANGGYGKQRRAPAAARKLRKRGGGIDTDMVGIGIDIGGTAVKLAGVDGNGQILWAARSPTYSRPSMGELAGAIREAAAGGGNDGGAASATCFGLCVPGLLDEDRTTVRRSVNVPGLDGVRLDELVAAVFGGRPAGLTVATDAYATAYDLYESRRPQGRLFVLAIGTGVGAAVLDGGRPLLVDGDSPGHFGQIDVSLEGEPAIGPDGGAGSLEGYLSAAALASRYGPEPHGWLERMRAGDPPLRALARAVRIAHGLFRPRHVLLAGGIGIRLGPWCPGLRATISHQLTNIADPEWTFGTGETDFHAARGAARLALRRP